MADPPGPPVNRCNFCQQPATAVPLSPCGLCNTVFYCSRNCQLADWGQHLNVCANSLQPFNSTQPSNITQPSNSLQPGNSLQPTNNIQSSTASNAHLVPQTQPSAPGQAAPPPVRPALQSKISNPFKRLSMHRWLHTRPEIDVYTLLIDTYRLRVYDDLFIRLDINEDSLYSQEGDNGEGGFRQFLQRVQRHSGRLLPSWWSPLKAEECVQLGLSGNEWSSLARTVNKVDIIDHYKDWMIPMQLRIFGESIYTGRNAMKGKFFKEQLELEGREQRR